jgi:hypothetical protein
MREPRAEGATPESLATELGVSGKAVRAFLRRRYPRPRAEWHRAWQLDATQVATVRRRFAARHRAKSREGMVTTTLALEAKAYHRLAVIAEREHVAIAEVLRRTVSEWLRRRRGGNP